MTHPQLLMADWHGDDLRREATAWRLAAEAVRLRRAAAPRPALPRMRGLTTALTTLLTTVLGGTATRTRALVPAVRSTPQPCGC